MKVTKYHYIKQVPQTAITFLNSSNSLYFTQQFLHIIESENKAITFSYLLLGNPTQPDALAIIQHMDVELDNATNQLQLHDKIAHGLRCLINNRKTQISVCGNIFLSGNYGVILSSTTNVGLVYKTIAKHILNSNKGKKSSIYFFKDFSKSELSNAQKTKKHNFIPFEVEPNMRLIINKNWNTVEDYKASLKSKYRVKFNKAYTTSKDLKIVNFTAAMIKKHSGVLQKLHSNVKDGAMIQSVSIQMSTYQKLKENFKENFFFRTYWYQEKIVGFATSFICNDRMDAHFIGIDYSLNKQLSIYPRILNDYVKSALENGLKELNLGRTSSEIKSTLGAVPQELTCFVRHKRTLPNMAFKPFIKQIKMEPFKQHKALKNTFDNN